MPRDAEIAGQMVCVLPDGVELTDEAWALIIQEWKRRRDQGQTSLLSADDVLGIINRAGQSAK